MINLQTEIPIIFQIPVLQIKNVIMRSNEVYKLAIKSELKIVYREKIFSFHCSTVSITTNCKWVHHINF